MMGALTTPRVRVVLDDDTEYVERIINIDMVSFDRERGRHPDWPTAEAGPMFWSTYLAWRALTRTNRIPKWSLPEFETRALQIEMVNEDASNVDPTQTEAEPE